jgi:cell division protein FtsN
VAGPRARPGPRGVFRVQVGAFLDHRNADRLIQRLRGENLEVADSIVEQSRVLYRVVARPREGEPYEGFLERLRGFGFTPETTGDGTLVTAPVPLHAAVEASRRLRENDVSVRLERAASAAAFRVVRVGRFATAEDAEHVRAELAGRGIEGFVVREP